MAASGQDVIDMRALEVAIEAKVRGESHENACLQKHESVQRELLALRKEIGAFKKYFVQAVAWVIVFLLGVIGWLIQALLSIKGVI